MNTIENRYTGGKTGLVVTAVMAVLGLAGIAFDLLVLMPDAVKMYGTADEFAWLHAAITLLMYSAVLLFAWGEYKSPFGNMKKNTMLFFSVCVMLQGIVPSSELTVVQAIFQRAASCAAAMMITYMAGRLNKLEKNKLLMVLIGLLIVIGRCFAVFCAEFRFVKALDNLSEPLIWAVLCCGYIARYKEHKGTV